MTSVICPFCGVVSEVRHETQQACIAALQAEITHTRRLLEHLTEPRPATPLEDEDKQLT
jgi:hypothetical protein